MVKSWIISSFLLDSSAASVASVDSFLVDLHHETNKTIPKMMIRVLEADWMINSFFIGLDVYFELGLDQSKSQFIKNNNIIANMRYLYVSYSA